MKVGTRLLLLSSFAAAVALCGWLANHWSAARVERAMQQLDYADGIQRAVTRLNTRFGLYLSVNDPHSLDEWHRAHHRLTDALAHRPDRSNRYIESIRYQNKTLERLSPLIDASTPGSPGHTQLTYRIYATLQEMAEDTLRLATRSEQRIRESSQQGRLITQGLMFALALVLTLIALQLAYSLKRRLDNMGEQLQHVAGGNLSVSLRDPNNDELGELARGFDAMLGRLRHTTISIDQLNEEIHYHTTALRNQQEYLETLIEAEPACVMTLDGSGRILSLNSAGARLLLTDSDRAKGRRFAESYVAEADRAAFEALVEAALTGQSRQLQFRLQLDHEDARWLHISAVPFQDRSNHSRSLITVSYDVSARVREEQKLQEAHTFLQNIVDSVQNAMVVRDTRFMTRLMNRAARDSETHHPCNRPLPQVVRAGQLSPSQRVLQGSSRESESYTYRRSDGEHRHIELVATPLTRPDGTLDGVIEVYRDITENTRLLEQLHREQSRLQQLAHHDQLTGLPNRTLLLDRLEQTLLRAKREQSRFALLFIDLDRFKEINDSLGHQAGDHVLCEAARRLNHNIRASDTLARIGGDEFTVIMSPLHHNDDAAVLAKKLIQCIEPPYEFGEQRLFVTTSIGISIYPHDGACTETLIRNADAAMYKAKDDGKNIYRYYSQQLTRRALEQVSLASELHRALAENEFCVHYQPQFELGGLSAIGMEALIRWQHPREGLIPPGRFLPIAEGSGLITRIGNRSMELVMQQTRQWRDMGFDPGVVAINLSGRQIDSERQLDAITNMLSKYRCDPRWFELEVTEDFVMQHPERSIELFNRLRELGFELAIDDFGTGFSSLSYLKRLPLTRLKIDQVFVRDLPDNADDQAISRAIIALGQNLKLKVIAEGVETAAQAQFLRQAGCDEVQGFLFSRPLPAAEITRLLKGHGLQPKARLVSTQP